MVRTQIQLPEEQYRRLRKWSRQLGISLSEAVRRCIADHLAHEEAAPSREDRIREALAVCGKYTDPEEHPASRRSMTGIWRRRTAEKGK